MSFEVLKANVCILVSYINKACYLKATTKTTQAVDCQNVWSIN